LEWYAQISDLVIMVEVTGKVSTITEAGNWIVTDVTARILESIRAPQRPRFLGGAEVSFTEEGRAVEFRASVSSDSWIGQSRRRSAATI